MYLSWPKKAKVTESQFDASWYYVISERRRARAFVSLFEGMPHDEQIGQTCHKKLPFIQIPLHTVDAYIVQIKLKTVSRIIRY